MKEERNEEGIIVLDAFDLNCSETHPIAANTPFKIEGYEFFKDIKENCIGVIVAEGTEEYTTFKRYMKASSNFRKSIVAITYKEGTKLNLAIIADKRTNDVIEKLNDGEVISILLGHAKKISKEIKENK